MSLGQGGLTPGTEFAGHRIEEVAGRGGMGVVYRARHLALDHVVALKVISPELVGDERFRRRFQSESRIAVSIRHPNVVSVHHAGEEDGLLFVTMDYVEGSDLRQLLNREGFLDPAHAARILAPLASALDSAHSRGLIHRDIKPGNVLIESANGEHVYLTDFGLARAIDAETGLTASGSFIGTLDYAAPEQIRGNRLDARTDIYALGCLLHEMLCGSTPFAKQTEKVAKMYAHLMEAPPDVRELRPELPEELSQALGRAIVKDPQDRYQSAGDFARAVEAAIAGRAVSLDERTVAVGAAAPEAPTEAMAAETRSAEPAAPTAPAGDETAPAAEPTVRSTHSAAAGRRRALALVAALGVIAAVVAFVALSGGGGDPEPAGREASGGGGSGNGGGGGGDGGPGLGDAEVAGQPIGLDGMPVGVAVSEETGSAWVGSRLAGTVTELDPGSGEVLRTIDGLAAPEEVTAGPASIYVALSESDEVLRINERTGLESTFAVGDTPRAVAHSGDGIYVTNAGSNSVTPVAIAPDSESPGAEIPVGAEPHGIGTGEGSVWVTNRGDGTVSRIDESSNRVTDTITVGANPKGVAVEGGTAWVANTDDDTVTPIDTASSEAGKPIPVAEAPRGVVAAFGSVWVANGAGVVTRIDPESGKVAQEIDVGGSPEEVAAGDELIWVSGGDANEVFRIEP